MEPSDASPFSVLCMKLLYLYPLSPEGSCVERMGMNGEDKRLDKMYSLRHNRLMRKTFRYRIYPTKKQQKMLEATLEECRWLYNHLLEMRKTAWEHDGKGLLCYGQQTTYPMLKAQRPSLNTVHSHVLQNVAVRVDLAMKAFFRRVKAGERLQHHA